jgi:hypothetical protein
MIDRVEVPLSKGIVSNIHGKAEESGLYWASGRMMKPRKPLPGRLIGLYSCRYRLGKQPARFSYRGQSPFS